MRTPKDGYVFGNAWQRAAERLALIEETLDPGTLGRLEKMGIGAGWQCLEAGAGGGSIAAWLHDRVGPSGRVVALDIETRRLEWLALPNLEVRQSDIAASAPESGAFDFVHARLLLEHVPARHAALRHLLEALRPGGWLLRTA